MYDYIIIGAGSAGCVLANRLSKNPQHKVLLLEAGGKDTSQDIKMPIAFSKTFKTKLDWSYESVPQKYMRNRVMFQPRGKVLGGCSSNNAMIYIRGNKVDYDHWASLGNKGWSYDEVLKYFKKSEKQQRIDDQFHGKNGELFIEERKFTHSLSHEFLVAIEEKGYPLTEDFNGAKQEGFGHYQVTHHDGRRWSAANAFLHPIKNRANLTTEINALAHRVILENGVAKGVEYEQKGKIKKAQANKEIIVCGGAFNSPHLLMLSGIGNGDELKKQNIDVKKHLPGVGKNLQDHLSAGIMMTANSKDTFDSVEDIGNVFGNLFNYYVRRKGPLTSNVAEGGGFIKSSPDEIAPDLQYHFAPTFFLNHGFEKPEGNGIALGTVVLVPKSRGTVSLASANPSVKALIDPNYFSDDDDMRKTIIGVKVAQDIMWSKAFAPYHKGSYLPAERTEDEEKIKDLILQYGETLYHPVGTCKMGNDEMAVVDNELRVHGVQNLRVVDASIMPTLVRGNTNAPTIMIAEKAADMILENKKAAVADASAV